MPLPLPQYLSLSQQFRESLDPRVRAEFDQFAASLQAQIPGIGVTRHCDPSEIIITGGTNTGGITGKIVRNTDPTYTHLSYAMVGRELMVVNIYILSATLTGTPNFIRINIPGGYQVKYGELVDSGAASILDAGTLQSGRIIVGSTGIFPKFVTDDTINFARHDGAAWTAGSIKVAGQITIPVEPISAVRNR